MADLHAIDGDGQPDDPLEVLLAEHQRLATLALAAGDVVLLEQDSDSPAVNAQALREAIVRQVRESSDTVARALDQLGMTADQATAAVSRLGEKAPGAYIDAVWPDDDTPRR